MSDIEFNTVEDLFRQASLRDRALAAMERKKSLLKDYFDAEVADLRADFEAFASTTLGIPFPDLPELHFIVEYHDQAKNEARLVYRVDGITFRCYYKREIIMKGDAHKNSDNPKEFTNPDLVELAFVVQVKRNQAWPEVKDLSDLGEQINMGGVF